MKQSFCNITAQFLNSILTDNENVVFKSGSDFTFEKNGTFKLTKNVKIEQGAKLKVINTNINYE